MIIGRIEIIVEPIMLTAMKTLLFPSLLTKLKLDIIVTIVRDAVLIKGLHVITATVTRVIQTIHLTFSLTHNR